MTDHQTVTIPIDGLIPYPNNPRRGNLAAIKESLETNGQFRPIIVQRSTNQILAGNHTVEAAKVLGWAEVQAWVLDVDDEQAARIVLADNRTSDLGWYEDSDLYALLNQVNQDTGLFGTGYVMEDLIDLEKLASLAAQDTQVYTGQEDFNTGFQTEGVGRAKSFSEQVESYKDKSIRTIILGYDLSEYEDVVGLLEQARKLTDTDNNATAVLEALRFYTS